MNDRISALQVSRIQRPGRHRCGENLYLQIRDGKRGKRKAWIFRYQNDGRAHMMGLGRYPHIDLEKARKKAFEMQSLIEQGTDPLQQKRTVQRDHARAVTFKQVVEDYIASHRAGWRDGGKSEAQWRNSIATHCKPILNLPVQLIDTPEVVSCLKPIWNTRTETASRVRGRIEAIIDYAIANKYRMGPNPAIWKGHISNLLPARSKVRAVKHLAAMTYAEVPGLIAGLREQEDVAAKALQFTILTAARAGEAFGARWDEVDFSARTWTIPVSRTKNGKPHVVPLSHPATELLSALPHTDGLIFPSPRRHDRRLSHSAMRKVLHGLGRADVTIHGFRSTFSTWAHETTSYPSHVIEMALAHTVGSEVERAYRRTDLLAKRTKLMEQWATYCATPPVERGEVVVPMRA
jgi:integrase